MKKFKSTLKPYFILFNFFLFGYLFGQTPEKMTYQAVVRNSTNGLVSNHAVGTQISILQGSATGTAVYVETHTTSTNTNGLMTLEIGNGTVISGNLSTINWTNGPYFLKTEIDPNGGTNYSITGVSQLLSVPFALHAKTAETLSNGITETDPLFITSPSFGISGTNITNWNNAFGWGNHATAGYLMSFTETDPIWTAVSTNYYTINNMQNSGGSQLHFDNLTNKPTTLLGYGITNAMSTSHPANEITELNKTYWNLAFSWGNHANAGYLTNFTENDPKIGTNTNGFSPKWSGTALVTGAVFQNDTGNVGIGTINPLSKLSVDGDANITTSVSTPIIKPLVGDGTTLTLLTNNATNASGGITIKTGNTTSSTSPNSSGSINISTGNTFTNGATTGSIILSAGKELWTGLSYGASLVLGGYPGSNQGGSTTLSGGNSWSDSGYVSLKGGNSGTGSGGNVYINGGNGGASVGGAGHVYISSGNDTSAGPGSLFFRINNIDAMHINALSNVGIGTVNPTQKLDVQGYINAASGLCIGGVCKSSWLSISPWQNNGSDYYYNSGKIGIGTSTPTTSLDVNGIITALDGNSTNWNTAYGWGDHATSGYITTETDGSVTNEIQTLSLTGNDLTISGTGGNTITLPTADGSETKINAGTNISISGTGTVANPYVVNSNNGAHYLGEEYLDGIIFYLYMGSDGQQHGLVVSKTGSTAQWQSTSSTTNATRSWDGAYNTNLMTNSPAKTWVTSLGADWYLPSFDELNILWNNRFHANKGLNDAGATLFSDLVIYWSSTEYDATYAYRFPFYFGHTTFPTKTTTYSVRAVRAF